MLLLLVGCLVLEVVRPGPARAQSDSQVVVDGNARFQVLSSTLVRVEYAADGQFHDEPTLTVANRQPVPVEVTSVVEDGERVIRTDDMILRYRLDSGPFTPENLSVEVTAGGRRVVAGPSWEPNSNPAPLGGWRRSLDYVDGEVELIQGILSRDGWALLNDSANVLLTSGRPGFAPRPDHGGAYQDGYLFGYGHDYAQGLRDLRQLTGPTPLLPKQAFGVWFSHWWPYTADTVRELVAQFEARGVPLDTFSIDTDFKRRPNPVGCPVWNALVGAPLDGNCSWNGWDWEPSTFPDPEGFLDWADEAGLEISLNVHPSINANDPAFPETNATAGGLPEGTLCRALQVDPVSPCHVFDWADPDHLDAYFDLHEPFEAQGDAFWWLDWCCDESRADAPGLTGDTWINRQYAQRNADRGLRWPAFSRIGASLQEGWDGVGAAGGAGALAEHTTTIHFTGDTCGPAAMLPFTAEFTAAEASIGMAYVSHDIGSFHGDNTNPCDAGQFVPGPTMYSPHLPDDLYVRWVQLGTFQPIDRLHSQHGDRLPWQYPAVEDIAASFLRLREQLVPYLYTLAREAHDTGLTMVRPLYMSWPEQDAAYAYGHEYLLGDDLLVAAVGELGESASTEVWIPPGTWVDWFTGEALTGPARVVRDVPLDEYPVFVRAGGVVVTQPPVLRTSPGPASTLRITTAAGGEGHLDVYDDEGVGHDYLDGASATTPITTALDATGCGTVTIGAAVGDYPGALATRAWEVEVRGVTDVVAVTLDGRPVQPTGSADRDSMTVALPELATDRAHELAITTASCRPSPSGPPAPTGGPPGGPAAGPSLPATGSGGGVLGVLLTLGAVLALTGRGDRRPGVRRR